MPLIASVRDEHTASAVLECLRNHPEGCLDFPSANSEPGTRDSLAGLLGACLAGDAVTAFTTTPDGGILGVISVAAPDVLADTSPGWSLPAPVRDRNLRVDACLAALWVDPAYRRRDLATAMLAFMRPAWYRAAVLATVPPRAEEDIALATLRAFGLKPLPGHENHLYTPSLTARAGTNHLVQLNR